MNNEQLREQCRQAIARALDPATRQREIDERWANQRASGECLSRMVRQAAEKEQRERYQPENTAELPAKTLEERWKAIAEVSAIGAFLESASQKAPFCTGK